MTRAFEPRDITRIAWVGDPQASPDGATIAFTVTRLSEERDEYQTGIWLLPTAGGEPRQLTRGPKRDRRPTWSPDGRQIAFIAERADKEKAQLYLIAVDGGEARRLTELKNGVRDFAWAPDGRRLVVTAIPPSAEPEPEEGKSKPPRVIDHLKYRSNGEGFIHDRRAHLYVVDVDDGEPRQITEGAWRDGQPTWSPDGSSIAFVSARHEERDRDNRSDLWLVSPEGGELRRLTGTVGGVERPAFSPDGATIAYFGHEDAYGVGRNNNLYVVPTAGGEPRCPSRGLDRNCHPLADRGPVWSADSTTVYFGLDDHGDVPVYRVAAAGGASERVVSLQGQVSGLSRAGADLAYIASRPDAPSELFADGRQLTDLNRAWRADVAPSKPERFRYQRDGQELDGWIVRPHGFEAGRRYPTLLNIHGGPHTQYGHSFFDEFQVYAGAGYAVIYTNPRGSHGYGEGFARAVIGDWGGVDFADVMAGVDEALRRFDFVDPARLGVMGGSYGGFMTSWTVSHTDRFKAACSERALNDWMSFFGTADIGAWFPMVESSGKLPWTDRSWFLERSPLTHAAQVSTPLLIIHAEDDLRCPISQGEQLFVALKVLGRDTRLVRFPDENHEMSRSGRVRHRLERFRVILDWFGERL